jgi:O-antigen/teichoic acid export membrane protein
VAIYISKYLRSIWRHLQVPFYNNAYSLIGLQIVASALGFAFLALLTRIYSSTQVGLGSGIFSIVTLLVSLAGLGLDDGLAYYLPRDAQPARLINVSLSLSAAAALVLAIAFLVGQRMFSPALSVITQSPLNAVVFVASTLLMSLSAIQDALFIAERASWFTLFKGVLVNLVRLPILLLMLITREWGVLLSMVLASLIGCLVFGNLYQRAIRPAYYFRPDLHPAVWKPILGYAFGNHLTNFVVTLPSTVVPLIILNTLGAAPTAYFYVAWMLASLMNVIGRAFGTSLLVESGREAGSVRINALRALVISGAVLVPAVIILSTFARPLLAIFGKDYGTEGTTLVVQLAISGIPLTLHGIAVGVLKARRKIGSLISVAFAFAALHIAGSLWLAPQFGLQGVGNAVIVARSVSALLGCLLAFQGNPKDA